MVSAVPVTTQDTDIPRWTVWSYAHYEVYASPSVIRQCTKSCACTACKTLSRIHSRVRWFTHVSCFSYARAHTLMCFVGLFPLIKFPQTHSRTRQCNLQVLASRVHGNATCKFELPKLGKIYKLSKFVLRGY